MKHSEMMPAELFNRLAKMTHEFAKLPDDQKKQLDNALQTAFNDDDPAESLRELGEQHQQSLLDRLKAAHAKAVKKQEESKDDDEL